MCSFAIMIITMSCRRRSGNQYTQYRSKKPKNIQRRFVVMPVNPGLFVGMNDGFVFHFLDYLVIVNEYFIGLVYVKLRFYLFSC
jgi:hypothetical protein